MNNLIYYKNMTAFAVPTTYIRSEEDGLQRA